MIGLLSVAVPEYLLAGTSQERTCRAELREAWLGLVAAHLRIPSWVTCRAFLEPSRAFPSSG